MTHSHRVLCLSTCFNNGQLPAVILEYNTGKSVDKPVYHLTFFWATQHPDLHDCPGYPAGQLADQKTKSNQKCIEDCRMLQHSSANMGAQDLHATCFYTT